MTDRSPRVDPAFLGAVVDTLLPGDNGTPPLPTGSAAGVSERLAAHLATGRDASAHLAVLDAMARRAGGEAAFGRSDAAARVDAVRAVERELGDAFWGLVSRVFEAYYDAAEVLIAMGWRVEPPQPEGHVLQPFDATLLDRVRRRGPMWRDAERPTGR